MIVLIDIGNSRTKYCLVEKNIRTPVTAISNELLNNDYLNIHFSRAEKIVAASVNDNSLTDKLSHWCLVKKVAYQRIVSEATKNNVITGYQQPEKLGVDRWLTLIATGQAFPNKNVLIVDAGTATTFDILASNGQHYGGWILAGLTTLVSSVLADTTKVEANEEEKESIAFGLNTSENVHNAAWAATIGAINLATSQALEQSLVLDEVIFTGGNGALLSSLFSKPSKVIDDLVLRGLQAYI